MDKEKTKQMKYINIVVAMNEEESPDKIFVDIEDENGESVNLGKWVDYDLDKTGEVVTLYKAIKIPDPRLIDSMLEALKAVRRMRNTPIVDDDFPEMLHKADSLVFNLLKEIGE